jgi:dipeptidase D
MNKNIQNLDPQRVWKHFYSLTQIPRPSKKEEAVIAFMKKFGEDLGLETVVDKVGNVIIRKPATPGMENRMGVIFQGHLDMVPQKNSDKVHDFEKDPIEAYIDGEWVTANGTTLGADNGMGCAAAMAVLESTDIPHGPIEALFTIDEETGMTGAFGLQPGMFKGDILMNLDSEDEGELYVGCAGGIDANITFRFNKTAVPANVDAYKISITGLKGGHSGMDIILQRGNANKIMTRFLIQIIRNHGVKLAMFDGGSLRNAIPREAFAVIVAPKGKSETLKNDLIAFYDIASAELSATEPEFKMTIGPAEMPKFLIDETTQNNVLRSIYACPNGVMRMSDSVPGLVETSNNLASVKTLDGEIKIGSLLRSSVDSAKEDLSEMVCSVFTLAGAECNMDGGYPGWKPNMESPVLKTMQDVYQKMYGKIPEIKAIHAGLECGLLGGVYPKWDMISFGPTIRYPHSPDEKVNIATVRKFWDYLIETLKNVPVK